MKKDKKHSQKTSDPKNRELCSCGCGCIPWMDVRTEDINAGRRSE